MSSLTDRSFVELTGRPWHDNGVSFLPGTVSALSWAAAGGAGDGVLIDTIMMVLGALGVFGVAVLVAAENLFPPIPSEIILPMAGFAAQRGEFPILWAVVAATVGSLLGAVALYWLGAWLGHERFLRLAARVPLVDRNEVERTVSWFRRHGSVTVFVGRMVPVFRSLISIPAGIERMPMLRFLLFTGLGSAIWNGALIGGGFLLGSRWEQITAGIERFQWGVASVVAVLLAGYVGWKVWKRKR